MTPNRIVLDIPNYEDLEKIRTLKIYDNNKTLLAELDEGSTRTLVNYAKENFLTIEEAFIERVGKQLKQELIKEIIKHPVKSIEVIKKLNEERK